MTTRRRQETADAEAATRRLAALPWLGGRSVATAEPPPEDPDDFDWFFPAPPPRPDVAPWSTPWPPEGGTSGGPVPGARLSGPPVGGLSDGGLSGAGLSGAGPLGAGPLGAGPAATGLAGDGPGSGRWRSLVDRAPEAVRGAVAVPLNAALAVVLVVAAVVAGVLLRSQGGSSGVVEVGPAASGRVTAAARPVGGVVVGAAVGSLPGTGGTGGAPAGGPARSAAAGLPGMGVDGAAPSGPVAVVVVDVVGRVRRPGLVRLPAGSRVADAVAAAGGPTDAAALPRINLARVLTDGEQVVVPDADDPLPAVPAAGGAGGAAAGAASGAATGPLDLNSATASDLDGLPGIGPVIAGRIVAWRAEHQRFTRVDELAEIPGIGDRLLERLRPLVTV